MRNNWAIPRDARCVYFRSGSGREAADRISKVPKACEKVTRPKLVPRRKSKNKNLFFFQNNGRICLLLPVPGAGFNVIPSLVIERPSVIRKDKVQLKGVATGNVHRLNSSCLILMRWPAVDTAKQKRTKTTQKKNIRNKRKRWHHATSAHDSCPILKENHNKQKKKEKYE